MRHDVSDATGWRDLVAATQNKLGRVNILINNAGVYRPSGLIETDDVACPSIRCYGLTENPAAGGQ